MYFLRFLEKFAYIIAYPLLFVVMNNSSRTRVAVRFGEELLLVRPRLNFGYWVLPGGGIKKSETPAVSAVREAREETGIEIPEKDLEFLSEQKVRSRGIAAKIYFFKADIKSKPELSLERYEIAEARWVTAKNIKKLPIARAEKRKLLELLTP